MADLSPRRVWSLRAIYVALVLLTLLFHLLPLENTPRSWAGADLIVVLTLAWSVRRPDCVPLLLVAALAFLADLLFQRPPGLWAALIVAGSEWLRSRSRFLRDAPFAVEWMYVALTILAATVIYRLVLAMTLVPVPSLTLSASQLTMTIFAYPVVVLISHYVLGVRRVTAVEMDVMGRRA